MNRIFVIAIAFMLGAGLCLSAAAQGDGGRPSRQELKKKFDKNGDGKLDQSERTALREAMKKRLGQDRRADRPGRRARPDAGQGQRRRGAFARRLRAVLDRNGDGKIGPVERRLGLRVLRRIGRRGGQDGSGATPRRLGRQDAPRRAEGRRPGARRQARAGDRARPGRQAGAGRGPGLRANAPAQSGRQVGVRRGGGARDGSGFGQGLRGGNAPGARPGPGTGLGGGARDGGGLGQGRRAGAGRNAGGCGQECLLINPAKTN